ncbi:MAG: methyl-accepting chemotaxis protein, partial [Deferrisomatales bacterium]
MSIKRKLSLAISVLVVAPMLLGGATAYLIARHHALLAMRGTLDNLARMTLTLCQTAHHATGAGEPTPALRQALLAVRVGESGYPFALRSDGAVVLHPKIEGQNLKGAVDARGKPFADEMLAVKDGWVEYWWKNPGEAQAREKLARVVYFEPWDWVIGVGSYEEEFLRAPVSIRNWTALGTVAALALALLLAYAAARSVGDPLRVLSGAFERLARGDLTAQVDVERRDEIGTLATAYRAMRADLSGLIRRVSQASGAVSVEAGQISAASQQVAAGAEHQSCQASEVAAAIEEVASAVLEVSQNAQDVAQSSQQMSDVARRGESLLTASLERMEGLIVTVEGLAEKIQGLGRRSEAIGAVIRVIDDIADQTNLLALNAAIEAARAGEHGRGFAV